MVTAAGFGAGMVVARIGDPGSARLASFLRLCGTCGVALTAGVMAVALGSHDPGVTAAVVGSSVLAVSAVLWRNGEQVLPFLSAVTGAVVTAAGLHDVVHLGLTPTEAALVVWGGGAALAGLGGLRLLHPTLPAMLAGEIGALGAALAVSAPHRGFGLALGLATGVAGLFAG